MSLLLATGLEGRAATPESEAAAPAAAASGSSQGVEPVTVIGKRRQRLQEVPGWADTLDGRTLEDTGARGQEDIFRRVPGVQMNRGQPNRALPTIRGIGTVGNSDLLGTQQATTGLYIEDVPFTDPFGFVSNADIAPFDLERIDLLRGPQGVLYGSASLGGAINYVLKRPDLDRWSHAVLAEVNRFDGGGPGRALHAMLNLPLVEHVAGLRAVAYERHDPGYIDNLGTGRQRANTLQQRGGRLIGTVRPAPGLQLTGTVLAQRTGNDDTFAVSPDPRSQTMSSPTPSSRRSDFTLRKLQLELALGERHALTAIGAVLDKRAAYASDVTRTNESISRLYGPLLGLGALPLLPLITSSSERPLSSHAVSQEWRIASTTEQPLRYMAGAIVQRTRFDWRGITLAPGGRALWGPAGVLLPQDVVGVADFQGRTTETAVFLDSDYRWASGWGLALGGRAYRTTLAYEAAQTLFGRTAPASAQTAESGTTPKLSLSYRFDEHLAYLLASKGYRFGGVNANPGQLTSYRSDSLWNHEAGLRLRPGAGLQLDLAAFSMDWKDPQVSTLLSGPSPIAGVANAGRARSQGLETRLNWQAPRQLLLSAALAYTYARTTAEFITGTGTVLAPGTRLPGTARWQTLLEVGGAFGGPAGSSGRLTASHTHVGPRVFDIEGRSRAPAHSLLDLRLALGKGPWTWSLGLSNALDERGAEGGAAVYRPGITSYADYYVLRPRHLSLSLRHEL